MSTKTPIILANFGGPRDLQEVKEFLIELLTDEDVIRTPFPRQIQTWLFRKIATRRAQRVVHDYSLIGGKSPLFEDTEQLALLLEAQTGRKVITFHRYLPLTHPHFLNKVLEVKENSFTILPLYPQQSFTTTGSVARFFKTHLPSSVVSRFEWIASYAAHPAYIRAVQEVICKHLNTQGLDEESTFFLFSAHGLPQKFIKEGDGYEQECYTSYQAIMQRFKAPSLLAFQSQFGLRKWLTPSTRDLCQHPHTWNQRRPHILIIPLSFTSDHLETLFEIEQEYIPLLKTHGVNASRCAALNQEKVWIEALIHILQQTDLCSNEVLIRQKKKPSLLKEKRANLSS
ncbi:MAG: ferrochelatase [Candidatus Rhabdochlamydia sp.]